MMQRTCEVLSARSPARKRIAIVQSSYIPWKGYFDLIAAVDEFVVLDTVQYTRRDWRNRNRIKTPGGPLWLTIPVMTKGRFDQRICDTRTTDQRWAEKHWRTIRANYARAPFFRHYEDPLAALFAGVDDDSLSAVNYRFLAGLCRLLNITTLLRVSTDYVVDDTDATQRLLSICRQAGATEYLSGPSARGYLDEPRIVQAGVTVLYADYAGYPEYPQLYPPFEHQVSVIDLLVHTGPNARSFMRAQNIAEAK
jgi:hypothetical protein